MKKNKPHKKSKVRIKQNGGLKKTKKLSPEAGKQLALGLQRKKNK